MDRTRASPTVDDALVEVAERCSKRSLVATFEKIVEIGQRREMLDERLIVGEIVIAKPQLHVGDEFS